MVYSEFQRGRIFLSDEFREGRPFTSVVATNVDAVREMIERDQHITYREIQATLWVYFSKFSIFQKHHFRVMIFYDYKCNLTQNNALIDFIWLLGMKHHPIGLFIIGLPTSAWMYLS